MEQNQNLLKFLPHIKTSTLLIPGFSEAEQERLMKESKLIKTDILEAYQEIQSTCGNYAVKFFEEEIPRRKRTAHSLGRLIVSDYFDRALFEADPLNTSVPVPHTLHREGAPIYDSVKALSGDALQAPIASAALAGEPTPIFDQLASA